MAEAEVEASPELTRIIEAAFEREGIPPEQREAIRAFLCITDGATREG